jgi:amino acid adenylation domain-containing protein
LIGLFINTLVLRTNLSGNPTFRELLRRVHDVALEAYGHQEIPFEKLMEELRVERNLTYSSLFQVMFVLQNSADSAPQLPGLTVSRLSFGRTTTMYDLFLSLTETADELHGAIFYRTDLFDAETISRMVGQFQMILEGVVANPDQRLSALPLLTERERRRLLIEWNDTKKDYPKYKSIQELFEAQAERTPDTTAVTFEGEQLTYRELNQHANRLARYLIKLGVGPEVLVGVYMERSLEMITGLLGILKAGGAYVPLELNYPMERLEVLLDDTRAPVLLTQQRLVETLPKHGAKVLCLDSDWETISHESEQKPLSPVSPDNLAYVIYTSGSTGKPKGVQITQRALVNFAASASTTFELAPNDRVLQFASISFDTAAEEIFPCLIRGATLVLRTDSTLDSVALFLQKCRDWGITVLDLPTVYWHEVTEKLSSEQLTVPEQLRLVIIGGEKANPERMAQWQKTVGDRVRLLNTYGPTEATVVTTMWELGPSFQTNGSLREVPIGRPIPNVQAYILDKDLNPVPIGVSGELHVRGIGLARGYLNRPDLTAEKFIPNPFSGNPGERLYKTGDLVRYLPEGNIEFVGRLDNQIKIRGFRIELGEVESLLCQHPRVRDTAVMVREDEPGNKCLVAYVAPRQQQVLTVSELRSFLKAKLPEHMMPSAFVFLDALPLTPNGKVDRRALPVPDRARPDLAVTFVAPRNPVEEVLAGIWAETLRLGRVGIYDNFFDLGGHSLVALQVMSRLQNALRVEVPLRTLFEKPTVAGLTAAILHEPPSRNKIERTAELTLKLSHLSTDEVENLLSEKRSLLREGSQ